MTRNEALSEAIRLRGEGKKTQEITEHLAGKGFRGDDGKPLTYWAVNGMLVRAGCRAYDRKRTSRKKRAPKAAAVPKDTGGGPPIPRGRSADARLKAVKSILSVPSIAPEERITLALLVLE